MNPDSPRLRLAIIGIVALSLFAAMFARLWYLQVLAAPEYQLAARANQQRVIVEEATRGRILDRNGVVVVDNRTSIVVTIDRRALAALEDPVRDRTLARLSEELTRYGHATSVEQLESRLVDVRFSPYTPVPVAEDIPVELEAYILEREDEFPAVAVEPRSVRTYPFGTTAAHLLGYVGAVTGEELEARKAQTEKPYQQGDEIGKSGVERAYEEDLRGVPGRRVLEVDADGDTIRQLPGARPPVPGSDIQLTIDIRLQALAEQALAEELARTRVRRVQNGPPAPAPAGSVVVLDPRDGSVLAMASYPTYDPTAFINGIDSAEWAALQDPAAHYPLNNRAIQGQYAPGSTFKLLTAAAALRSGAIAANSTIVDAGSYRLNPCRGDTCIFRNAGSRRYGRVNVTRAITVSSDVFFYDLGARFFFEDWGGDPMQATAREFGLGSVSGIPLPSEQDGFIPDAATKQARHDSNPTAFPDGRWRAGDNVITAIGQGDVLVTPLQLANAYATFANGGYLFSPNVVLRVLEPGRAPIEERIDREIAPRLVRQVALPPEVRDPILQGLIGVTAESGGTAHVVFRNFPAWTVAAKTGTAEVAGKADTAVFTAFAPAEAPQYVVAAILEESGFGGVAAAPLVRRILEPLADPTQMPEVGPGGVLSFPIPEAPDPQSEGGVID